MLFLKLMMMVVCFGFLACAAGMVLYDLYLAYELDRILRRKGDTGPSLTEGIPVPVRAPVSLRTRRVVRWSAAAKLAILGAVLGLAGKSILVVPDGQAAVRLSQISGVRPGTLYAGTHLLVPMVEHAALYDIRD